MKGWTTLYSSTSPIDAQLVVNELLSHDMHAILLNKQDSSYHIGRCEVLVPEEQALLARLIVDLYKNDETKPTE